MKKCAIFVVIVFVTMMFWTTGCTDKARSGIDTLATDSIVDTTKVDSLEMLLEEQPMPKAADELFDDFIFNFAGNNKLQLRRVKFPLMQVNNGDTSYLSKEKWQVEHFFMRQGYYTLILDSRRQLQFTKDTNVERAVVEKIFLNRKFVKSYVFQRIHGEWMLTSVEGQPLVKNVNASFLQFYQRFATDSAFLHKSLNETIAFSGPDPDDDFAELHGDIMPEQWDVIGPTDLPSGTIYNINYGQTYKQSGYKVFLLRGIANGEELEMTFQRKDGQWMLTRLVE
ncbi:MAG: DUF4348 domain-containing protein [Prevotella sp.]|nr:DUF4348 domain-containing protein [Prevotella sp.]MBQ8701364.1 DUF4348 domain-containing protein [Prevotella sp.]MBQ9651954.1 DUF4348 domain-containing protein [Prevotella sp.]